MCAAAANDDAGGGGGWLLLVLPQTELMRHFGERLASTSDACHRSMIRLRPVSSVTAAQRPSRPPTTKAEIPLSEVAKHATRDDGWIVVDGVVYDITNFVQNHPGWSFGGSTSTALAIERVLGTDCTDEFAETHDKHQTKMLREYAIGTLCDEPDDAATVGDAAEPGALGDPLAALPTDLLDRVWVLLDVAGVHAAAAVCDGLLRHARRFGDGRYLPCHAAEPAPSPTRGVAIAGGVLAANPRWMSLGRVVDVPVALSPYFMFRVRVRAMRSLTLEIGVAADAGGRTKEWFVDGAGRAVVKIRGDHSVRSDVAFAYGHRFGAGERVGLCLGGGALRFFLGSKDLGVAFSGGVPRHAKPFVRFPTGGNSGESGDAVEILDGREGDFVRASPDGARDAPSAIDGHLVVQLMGPELDDWLSFKAFAPGNGLSPRTATVRFLRSRVAAALAERQGSAVDEECIIMHFGPLLQPRAAPPAAATRAGRHAYGAARDADLDRPLADFRVAFLDNGVQSRPIYASLDVDIS